MPPASQSAASGAKVLRLDQALVDSGLCLSREKAQRAVLAGLVRVNHQLAHKPGDRVKPADQLSVAAPEPYVSRGGHKLEHALRQFPVDVRGMTAIDCGASTGGFTDCLLQHGAKHVFAVDVGTGQLAWKLRQDARVTVMEKKNARILTAADFPPGSIPVDLVVIDCSFISLRLIVPAMQPLLRPAGCAIALVKPQFEAGKLEVDRGRGVITSPDIHNRVLADLARFIESSHAWNWRQVIESPLRGPAGNKEFLLWLEKTG
jgi:23S rRNA (cytidine1920-2'-O)/16S rRNA (cytidine1409-2'-O)-methyltransferase